MFFPLPIPFCTINPEVNSVRQLYNLLLGFGFGICLYLLVFQGFAAPALPPLLDGVLRFVSAGCIQFLALRIGKHDLIRMVPFGLAFLLAVWGFFLFLTSPSWQNATFGDLFADYMTPLFGCLAACLLHRRLYR